MNLFRLCGDMSHLLSIMVLLLKIRATKSCRGARRSSSWDAQLAFKAWGHASATRVSAAANGRHGTPQITSVSFAGISLKTQELYALVFVCRYLDLFYSYISL